MKINLPDPADPGGLIGEGRTMATKTAGKVVFTGTWQWWEIVSQYEIETTESYWSANAERAAGIAGTDAGDDESWVCRVIGDTGRHTAIREGDYACCRGYGSDVVFVRL